MFSVGESPTRIGFLQRENWRTDLGAGTSAGRNQWERWVVMGHHFSGWEIVLSFFYTCCYVTIVICTRLHFVNCSVNSVMTCCPSSTKRSWLIYFHGYNSSSLPLSCFRGIGVILNICWWFLNLILDFIFAVCSLVFSIMAIFLKKIIIMCQHMT